MKCVFLYNKAMQIRFCIGVHIVCF